MNVLAHARYALYKLNVRTERSAREPQRARKDIVQANALLHYFRETGQSSEFNAALHDAHARGALWQARIKRGNPVFPPDAYVLTIAR